MLLCNYYVRNTITTRTANADRGCPVVFEELYPVTMLFNTDDHKKQNPMTHNESVMTLKARVKEALGEDSTASAIGKFTNRLMIDPRYESKNKLLSQVELVSKVVTPHENSGNAEGTRRTRPHTVFRGVSFYPDTTRELVAGVNRKEYDASYKEFMGVLAAKAMQAKTPTTKDH